MTGERRDARPYEGPVNGGARASNSDGSPVRGTPVQGGDSAREAGFGSGARAAGRASAQGSDSTRTDWLTDVLVAEADQYEPDTGRIRSSLFDQLEVAPSGQDRRRFPALGLRLAGVPVGLAVAALCGTVAVAVTATVATRPHASTIVAGGDSPSPASAPPTAVGESAHSESRGTQTAVLGGGPTASPAGSAAGTRSPSPFASISPSGTGSPASAGGNGNGLITTYGAMGPNSTDSWSEQDVRTTLTAPASAFQLSVKIAMTPGLSSTGYWCDYNIKAFDVSVTSEPDGLLYTFQLKSGETLRAGQATFAVQFNHGPAHNPANDTYWVTTTSDPADGSVAGRAQGAF